MDIKEADYSNYSTADLIALLGYAKEMRSDFESSVSAYPEDASDEGKYVQEIKERWDYICNDLDYHIRQRFRALYPKQALHF